jgi:hypothetical protein
MQKLEVYQSRWAMELRRPDGVERSDEEAFAMVAEAGFDGMCLDLAKSDLETIERTRPLFEQHKLGCMINAFPKTVEGFLPILEAAKAANAVVVNIIGEVMPFTVEDGVDVVHRWMEMSDQVGMPILFETHRNCLTNDLFYTLQLMECVPDMPICADLSHYLIDREFWYPLNERDQGYISQILARADCFQGRVSSREQVQVPLHFPQSQKWVDLYKSWWEEGIASWKGRHGPDDTLIFLTELGPPEYAITGADGYELSNRWEESLQIKGWVEDIWARV